MTSETLDRYRSLVPDWERFTASVSTPEPTHLRVRDGRAAPGAVVRRLEAQGFGLEAVPGLEGVHEVVREPFPVAHTLEHWDGLVYIQQAVTAVAAPALGARPGERVLDLAAAPGGKTTHLADLMDDRGSLVANDRSEKRLQALMANVYRTAHPGIAVLSGDGRSLPGRALFDRVLVDAPCSGEGNLRSRGGELPTQSARFQARVVEVQEALLRRAIELTRPGGVVLYCTCTFNPDENEGVVDRVLGDGPVELERIPLELPHAPGVERWDERRFDASLERAWRLYPYHLDSGGLFLARLRKREDAGDAPGEGGGWEAVPAGYGPGDRDGAGDRIARVRALFRDGYGVAPELLDGLGWMVRGDSVWVTTAERVAPELWRSTGRHRLVALGLRATKLDGRIDRDRATNDVLAWLGDRLTRRVVEIGRAELAALLDGGRLEAPVEGDGFVALRFAGRVVGRALVLDGTVVRHEIPKARAARLRDVLEALETAPGPSRD